MLATDLQPGSIVEDEEFLKIDPKYKPVYYNERPFI